MKLPDEVSDDQATMLSDIFPTGYFGAKLAEIKTADTVTVFGCGPGGQFAIASAKLLGAGRVFDIDQISSRLEWRARRAPEVIDFNTGARCRPYSALPGVSIGVDRAIDAVGVDGTIHGPAAKQAGQQKQIPKGSRADRFQGQSSGRILGWVPGDAPS